MFLAIGGEGLPEASNLAMIRFDPAHQAFTAGFLAMLVTFDWRSSALLPDTPESAAFAAAFRNGARYFCGRCGTFYAPYADFPLIGAAPAGSGPVEFKAALDTLLTYSVYSVYLSPEAASPEILGEIFNRQLVMIGGQSPPTEVRDRWAATIRPDLSSTIRKLWPDLLAGKGGGVHAAALEITDIQPQILTQGRLDLVNRMREDLSSGLIDPLAPALQ
jgi:hypothetical protein